MAKTHIGDRPASITKEDGKIKVVFHPITKNAKHPDAAIFSVKLSKADLEILRKSL